MSDLTPLRPLAPLLQWAAENVDLWRGPTIAVLGLFMLACLCWAAAVWENQA